jgi:hypothetical protein
VGSLLSGHETTSNRSWETTVRLDVPQRDRQPPVFEGYLDRAPHFASPTSTLDYPWYTRSPRPTGAS